MAKVKLVHTLLNVAVERCKAVAAAPRNPTFTVPAAGIGIASPIATPEPMKLYQLHQNQFLPNLGLIDWGFLVVFKDQAVPGFTELEAAVRKTSAARHSLGTQVGQ